MNIFLIDDYPPFLESVAAFLRQNGHAVSCFRDPVAAMANVSQDVELVISDVMMPVMDGFRVAREVESTLGGTRPRTLLTSGHDFVDEMQSTPPARVIGFVRKPALVSTLKRILPVLEEARACCPGRLPTAAAPGNPTAAGIPWCQEPECELCHSPRYAGCPHYNKQPGPRFRQWVETPVTFNGQR